jgi:hypothetical protein
MKRLLILLPLLTGCGEMIDPKELAMPYLHRECVKGFEFWRTGSHDAGEFVSLVPIYGDDGERKRCR